MRISSPNFEHLSAIPEKFTCDGEDVCPELHIEDVPQGTRSLALVMDDPYSPTGNWIHWTLWNIDPGTKKICEATEPYDSVEGITSFNNLGYGGPCPHQGTHRYFFKLYALDAKLDLMRGATSVELEKAMEGHILEQAELMGLYTRI